ncbi:MAG: ribosome silencing factor [Balneolaceae bacterium]
MSDIIKEPKNKQFSNTYTGTDLQTSEVLDIIVESLLAKKANDITLLDVSELTTLTEFFVICHGNSDVQIKALADAVEEDVFNKTSEKVWKKEGVNARTWMILDYVNIVVHVMTAEKREYYGIERMWNDAKITRITDSE